jgi:hypothetical protein
MVGGVLVKMKTWLVSALVATFAALFFCALSAQSQSTALPLGKIDKNMITKLPACPIGYYPGMTCYTGKVYNCANAVDLGFTYGTLNPALPPVGTVVFLEGGGGNDPFVDPHYANKYLQQNLQVVYLAWDADWEYTGVNSGTSIKYAACRPATFLNYVYQNLNSTGSAMCAQGASAGAGAVAYTLAWYGGSTYLDNVELLSGPVFSDIKQGCEVPNARPITVCPTGQLGCVGKQWSDSPVYVDHDEELVGPWSGFNVCNEGGSTSPAAESAWKSMSIVDGTRNPTFNYPQTAMAGWLCSNVNSKQNNSAAQGQFFYEQFTTRSQTASYSLTRIDHCQGAEGVDQGTTPKGELGVDAIGNDMLSACRKRH